MVVCIVPCWMDQFEMIADVGCFESALAVILYLQGTLPHNTRAIHTIEFILCIVYWCHMKL